MFSRYYCHKIRSTLSQNKSRTTTTQFIDFFKTTFIPAQIMRNSYLTHLPPYHIWEAVTMAMPPRNGSDTGLLDPSVWQDMTALVTCLDETCKPSVYTITLRRPIDVIAFTSAYNPEPFSQAVQVENRTWPQFWALGARLYRPFCVAFSDHGRVESDGAT
jgi:hypothetical protein